MTICQTSKSLWARGRGLVHFAMLALDCTIALGTVGPWSRRTGSRSAPVRSSANARAHHRMPRLPYFQPCQNGTYMVRSVPDQPRACLHWMPYRWCCICTLSRSQTVQSHRYISAGTARRRQTTAFHSQSSLSGPGKVCVPRVAGQPSRPSRRAARQAETLPHEPPDRRVIHLSCSSLPLADCDPGQPPPLHENVEARHTHTCTRRCSPTARYRDALPTGRRRLGAGRCPVARGC